MIDLTKKVCAQLALDEVLTNLDTYMTALGKARKVEVALWASDDKARGKKGASGTKAAVLEAKAEKLRGKAETARLVATVDTAVAIFKAAKRLGWPDVARVSFSKMGVPVEQHNVLALGVEYVIAYGWKTWAVNHGLADLDIQAAGMKAWVGKLHPFVIHSPTTDAKSGPKSLLLLHRAALWAA